MKAFITIAALTISFSAYADHAKGHKGAMKPAAPAPTEAKAGAPTPADAKIKADCEKTHKTPAEVDACIAAKKGGTTEHM